MIERNFDREYVVIGTSTDRIYLFDKDSNTPLWKYETGGSIRKIFISKDGFNVNSKAISYLEPLIVGEAFPEFKDGIPRISNLKLLLTPKKLKKYVP